MKKPTICYELEHFDSCLPPSWEVFKTFSATSEKQARREWAAGNKRRPGEFRLYRVERKMLRAKKPTIL